MNSTERAKPEFTKNISADKIEFKILDFEDILGKLKLKPFGTLRIDWSNEDIYAEYHSNENNLINEIIKFLSDKDGRIYIIWDDGSLLDIEAPVSFAIKHLNDICHETYSFWIIDCDYRWIIECFRNHEVIIKLQAP